MVGILYHRLCSFSQSISQIPALVIVMSQQGLIWRVQGSPRRKLNFLFICTTIIIIILLIRTAWQILPVPTRKQLQSFIMFSKMSCRWLLSSQLLSWHHLRLTQSYMLLSMRAAYCKSSCMIMSWINANERNVMMCKGSKGRTKSLRSPAASYLSVWVVRQDSPACLWFHVISKGSAAGLPWEQVLSSMMWCCNMGKFWIAAFLNLKRDDNADMKISMNFMQNDAY